MKLKTIILLILISLTLGCISQNSEFVNGIIPITAQPPINETPIIEAPINNETTEAEVETTHDTIRIGAFNVQVFGVTKASKPEVMNVLADIIRTYDVIAIQEIRDSSQTALPALVDLVNSDGSEYSYVVSERLGRTSSKEQYAYIYNTQTVSISNASVYPEPDGTDPFHRQPFIASIEALQGNFDAVLIVIHTDPDEATEEINGLDYVLAYAQSQNQEEDDFIIMGDLNADGSYFDEDSTSELDAYHWIIDDSQDTTTKSTDYTYDRIILTDTSKLHGEHGVLRYDLVYALSQEQTVSVSDHYPVYVEFRVNGDMDE